MKIELMIIFIFTFFLNTSSLKCYSCLDFTSDCTVKNPTPKECSGRDNICLNEIVTGNSGGVSLVENTKACGYISNPPSGCHCNSTQVTIKGIHEVVKACVCSSDLCNGSCSNSAETMTTKPLLYSLFFICTVLMLVF